MARPRANILTIEPLPNGHFCLFGYYSGNRIRKRSKNFGELQKLKEELDGNTERTRQGPILRATWLNEEELREAEAAVLAAKSKGRSVLKIINEASGSEALNPKEWDEAIAEWLSFLTVELKRFPRTIEKNKDRILKFRSGVAGTKVHETTPEEFERYVLRPGVMPQTQLTDGSVVRAFFNFALRQTRRWVVKSPVSQEIMEDLQRRASAGRKRPRILSIEHMQALLTAADKTQDGKFLPYVVLATWLFLRHAEVLRIDPAELVLTRSKPHLEIEPRKQGTPSYRVVTIPENARQILLKCFDRGLLTKGKPVYFERRQFEELRTAAGIDERTEPNKWGWQKLIRTDWQDNILRHTGISYLYQRTGDIKEVVRQAGNSDDTSFKHYLHLPKKGAFRRFFSATV